MAQYVAVDWGTTSFRLWLIGSDGAILGESRSREGMTTARETGFAAVLDKHLAEVGAPADAPVIMCGMVGAKLTSVPGASDVFVGGVVSYASRVKYDLLEVPEGPVVTEAAAALADLCFDRLDARRVELRMDDRNAASWRVAERIGFTLEGVLRDDSLTPANVVRSTRVYARVRPVAA